MEIAYHYENKYGNKLRYVSNDATAAHVRTLTGRATLSDSDIQALTGLGHTLVHVPLN